jgi:hypothetical protein
VTAAIYLAFEVKGTRELAMRPNCVIVYRVLRDAVRSCVCCMRRSGGQLRSAADGGS